jgi:MFS family permease
VTVGRRAEAPAGVAAIDDQAAGPVRDRWAAALERRGRYPRAVLLVALSGLFATTFPITVLTLALPTIADDFGVSETRMAWVVTLPMISSALALPILGKLGDLHGHRRVFVTGYSIAVVFTALSALAPTAAALIGLRTLAQVAGASTMPSSLALINGVHHGERRAKAMGWWSMVAAGAPVIGLTVGAPAIDAVGWQMLFLIQAVLMVGPAVASWALLRETPRRDARFDGPGAVALAVAVGPLLLVASEVRSWGVVSGPTLVCVVLTLVGATAFWKVERRSEAPLVPLAFLRDPPIASTLLVSLFTGAAYMGGFFLASLMVVEQFDYSLTSAVPILSIRPVLFAITSPLGGWVTARLGARASSVAGCVSLTGGMIGLLVGSATDSLLAVVLAGFVLQGTGYGLLRPAVSTALADAVDEHDLGMAGAAERLIGQIGVVFGITVMASTYGGDVDQIPLAFGLGAASAALGTVAALRMAARATAAAGGPADAVPVDTTVG